MNRRYFLGSLMATAGGLLVLWAPRRARALVRVFDERGGLLSESDQMNVQRYDWGYSFGSIHPRVAATGLADREVLYDQHGREVTAWRGGCFLHAGYPYAHYSPMSEDLLRRIGMLI